MAIIGIRDLVRTSKGILARVEQEKEPFLITRHGQPVAALVPVDPAEAERYVLAAAPALVESRRRAEDTPRQTRSIDEVARKLKIETDGIETEDPQPQRTEEPEPVEIAATLRPFVGEHLAQQFGHKADERLEAITDEVLTTAESTGLVQTGTVDDRAKISARVHAVNQVLLGLEMRMLLAETAVKRLEELGSSGKQAATSHDATEGVFGSSLADEALEGAVMRVNAVNNNFFALAKQKPNAFSIAAYELSVLTGIEMLYGNMLSPHAKPEGQSSIGQWGLFMSPTVG
jgi:prevent-host-death family protein